MVTFNESDVSGGICSFCRSNQETGIVVCGLCNAQFIICELCSENDQISKLPCGCEWVRCVTCPWVSQGCCRLLTADKRDFHAAHCSHGQMKCSNTGCYAVVSRNDIQDHEQNQCNYAIVGLCRNGCGLPLTRGEEAQHNCIDSLILMLSEQQVQSRTLQTSLNDVIQKYKRREQQLNSALAQKSDETNPNARVVGVKRRSTVSYVTKGSSAHSACLTVGDILLSVNGHDLSDATHEETVKAFHEAKEPIIVEVLRRSSNSAKHTQNKPITHKEEKMNSVSTQTDGVLETEFFSQCFRAPSPPPLYSLENLCQEDEGSTSDMLGDEDENIEYEEIVLHRETSKDRIGLTLCYGQAEEDGITDIFIGEVELESVAHKDGRIREGDQILQINNQDVKNREEAIKCFSENRSDISLLVCRPSMQMDDGFVEEPSLTSMVERQRAEGMTLIEERSEEEESTMTDTATLPSQKEKEGKDSGVGHDSAANDESSEQEYDSPQYDSHNSSHLSTEHEHEYKDKAQQQSAMFREVLEARCTAGQKEIDMDTLTRQMNALCALVEQHQQNTSSCPESHGSPRMVPRMGLRTIHHTNESPPSSTLDSNSSRTEEHNPDTAYNTAESCNSSPMTLELTRDHSSSTLCLQAEEDNQTTPAKEHSRERRSRESSSSSSKKSERRQKHRKHNNKSSTESNSDIQTQYGDITYTNEENLAQTIAMQQQILLEQSRNNTLTRKGKSSETESQLPNMSDAGSQMEWVVKRRADGSRYVTRRPIRNKILSARKKKLEDERCGMTTDDDAMSEMKTGRYWSKEDKKRHLQKARDYKQRKELMKQKMDTLKEVDEGQVNIVELSHKKLYKNTIKDMNFTTVQEILVHGGKIHDPRYNLLSVTTV